MLSCFRTLAASCLIFGAVSASLAQSLLYDNGAIAAGGGPVITYGWQVTDSFNLTTDAVVESATVGLGLFSGDALRTMNWSITTASFGGTVEAFGTTTPNLTFVTDYFGSDLYAASFSIAATTLTAGTHWLQLDGAQTIAGNTMYWYENNGTSIASQYDPSTSSASLVGSESFQIYGSVVPEPSPLTLAGWGGFALLVLRCKKVRETGTNGG